MNIENGAYWQDAQTVDLIRSDFDRNRVVIGTSDTVPGFLAPLTEAGYELLQEIKKRDKKPFIVLIKDKERARLFVEPEQFFQTETLMAHCWPGPLTLVLRARATVPWYLRSAQGTIALRVPKHDGLLALLNDYDGLFSSSANRAGESAPKTMAEVDPDLIKQVGHLIIEKNEIPSVVPSTIIDCTGPVVRVIREGAYPVARLESVLGQRIRS